MALLDARPRTPASCIAHHVLSTVRGLRHLVTNSLLLANAESGFGRKLHAPYPRHRPFCNASLMSVPPSTFNGAPTGIVHVTLKGRTYNDRALTGAAALDNEEEGCGRRAALTCHAPRFAFDVCHLT